jgi:hypothetical protein
MPPFATRKAWNGGKNVVSLKTTGVNAFAEQQRVHRDPSFSTRAWTARLRASSFDTQLSVQPERTMTIISVTVESTRQGRFSEKPSPVDFSTAYASNATVSAGSATARNGAPSLRAVRTQATRNLTILAHSL